MERLVKDYSILSERAEEVDFREKLEEINQLYNEMEEFLNENPEINYLSAPQFGKNYRMFCIRFEDGIKVFVNPILTKSEGMYISRETNPSLDDNEYLIPRYKDILVTYQTLLGSARNNKFEGFASAIVQHEMDLLDGILISDLGLKIDEDFDKATEEERQEVVSHYIDWLKELSVRYNEDIENNEELRQTKKAIEFMTKVQTGELQLQRKRKGPKQEKVLNRINEIKEKKFLERVNKLGS